MADTFKYVQAQTFSLSGAGAVAGATQVVLKSFTQIDGTLLTMTNFGSIGFMTLEPGNGTLEEQICFTGVTQNANGTATLTGVSTVLMISPYTQTSGLAQTHAGSTTAVISNTAGFYDRLSAKADDETITGIWTFTNPNYPRMDTATPYPTDNEQLATKAYADSLTFSGAPDATTTQKGIVELATQAEVDAGTATGGTGASIVATPAVTRSRLLSDYVADTGAADAYVITPAPAISAYATGQVFSFKAANTNTTTSTIAVSGLSAKTIKKVDGATNLSAGDIVVGQIILIEYDGTNFQMLNPLGRPGVYLTAGAYPAGTGAAITGVLSTKKVATLTTDVVIASSTVETTLFTGTVPANTLSTNNALRCRINFNLLRLSDTKTCTIRVKYGANTVITFVVTGDQSLQTSNQVGWFDILMFAAGATNSQAATLNFICAEGSLGNTSIGANAYKNMGFGEAEGTAASDSTGALAFTVTAQMNNSSANDTLTASSGVIETIQ